MLALGERERALIDLAARMAGDGGDLGDRLLHGHAVERVAQQRIEIGGADRGRVPVGRADHDDDLAARLRCRGVVAGERREIAAAHLLVQLGELAADRSLARSQAGGEVGERGREARPGLEQHQRHRHAASSAMRARRCPSFPGRKPSKKKRSVGSPATVSAASTADAPGSAVTP